MTQDIAQQSIWTKVPFLKPYALLARWDRPIGIWLVFWPAIWGLALAPEFKLLTELNQIYYIALFFIGAIAMRGAGCTINDLMDRKMDARVERTKNRPLANGTISLPRAVIFMILQLIVGAAVLFQLPPLAIYIGLASLPLIAAYPLMKRITWWPQVFLGIVFNSGALIGWAVTETTITPAPLLLYLSGIFWTLAYDTVYAHMDTEDDALIGIKSTALRWGPDSKTYVGVSWVASAICFAAALMIVHATPLSFVMLAAAFTVTIVAHSFWNPLNDNYSLAFFRLQAKVGFLLALAALVPVLL